MLFEDILLTVDFDRTLTAPDCTIPQRNLDAIVYFMENGGSFTVNTGRSTNTFRQYLHTIPHNVPFLMYNGSACYENGRLTNCRIIDLDVWEVLQDIYAQFPDLNLEVQAADTHYLYRAKPGHMAFYDAQNWQYSHAVEGTDMGPFIKFSLFGATSNQTVDNLFHGTDEDVLRFRQAYSYIQSRYGDKLDIFVAAPKILDMHAKGSSKLQAARDLQKRLGKKILVCVGDAENDLPMLQGADFAYCPADGVVADRFETVCNCAEGAVADVIYKKIPEILQIQP